MGIKEIAKLKEWSLNSTWDDRKNSEKLKKDGRQKFVASYFILTANSIHKRVSDGFVDGNFELKVTF